MQKSLFWIIMVIVIASLGVSGVIFTPDIPERTRAKQAVFNVPALNGTPIVAQPVGGGKKSLQILKLNLVTITPGAGPTGVPSGTPPPTPNPTIPPSTTDRDGDGYLSNVDCDDNNPTVFLCP